MKLEITRHTSFRVNCPKRLFISRNHFPILHSWMYWFKLVEYFTFNVSRKTTKRKIIGRLTPLNDSGAVPAQRFYNMELSKILSCRFKKKVLTELMILKARKNALYTNGFLKNIWNDIGSYHLMKLPKNGQMSKEIECLKNVCNLYLNLACVCMI